MKSLSIRMHLFIFFLTAITLLPFSLLSWPPVATLKETPEGFYNSQRITIKQRSTPPRPKTSRLFLNYSGEAKDQGPLGTCVSFTIGACFEMLYPGRKFSVAELTILTETQLPYKLAGDCKSGLFLGNALRVAQKFGMIPESDLSYDPRYLAYVAHKGGVDITKSGWRNRLSTAQDPDICSRADYNRTMNDIADICVKGDGFKPIKFTAGASRYDFSDYRLNNLYEIRSPDFKIKLGIVDKIKWHLSQGHPVATAVPVFDLNSKWQPSSNFPRIKMPTRTSSHDGNHAFVLTGYDDRYGFSFRNSWGTNWGSNGFGWIPYNYIDKYAHEIIGVGK